MFDYTPPIEELPKDNWNQCKNCIEEGLTNRPAPKGTIYVDSCDYIICPDCYQELKRRGIVW